MTDGRDQLAAAIGHALEHVLLTVCDLDGLTRPAGTDPLPMAIAMRAAGPAAWPLLQSV